MNCKIKIKVLFLLLTFSFPSCINKNLAKRYRNVGSNANMFAQIRQSQAARNFVQVDLQSVMVNQNKSKKIKYNLLSLSDKGQKAFISSAKKLANSDEKKFLSIITSDFPLSGNTPPRIKVIPKTIKKTLVFTVDRRPAHFDPVTNITTFNLPGDRISYLQLNLDLPPGTSGIFKSWDKYVTDKITLNLGKVSSAQNWNASLNLSAKGAIGTNLVE